MILLNTCLFLFVVVGLVLLLCVLGVLGFIQMMISMDNKNNSYKKEATMLHHIKSCKTMYTNTPLGKHHPPHRTHTSAFSFSLKEIHVGTLPSR